MQRLQKSPFVYAPRAFWGIFLCLGVGAFAAYAAEVPLGTPTLPSALFDTEKQVIQHEDDPKNHVEVCLKVGAIRLSQAFEATRRQEYSSAAKTLTVYNQLLAYTHDYARSTAMKGKKRDQLYRLIETALRRHTPTLEAIAQETPANQEDNARAALTRAREIRRVTLNAVFGGDFFKDDSAAPAATAGFAPQRVPPAPPERKGNN